MSRRNPRRGVTPIEALSRPALIALVKLAVTQRTLCTSNYKPYEEVQKASYAYRVGLDPSRFCFVINTDNQEEILVGLGLASA